jgi:hypothetical protein
VGRVQEFIGRARCRQAAELFVLSQWLAFAVEVVDWEADCPRMISQSGFGPGNIHHLSLSHLDVPSVATILPIESKSETVANLESTTTASEIIVVRGISSVAGFGRFV